jgi:hypothetical protein
MFKELLERARAWSIGKGWWWRIPLLIWFGYILVLHMRDPRYSSIIAPFNLAIHEMGHMLFGWAGQTLSMLGGTITQLAAPVLGIWNFLRQEDYFACSLCLGWLSTNLFNVSMYIADARSMTLELVAPFGVSTVIHDWNFLLDKFGLLAFDHVIAGLVWLLAVVAMLACQIAGGWLLWQMMTLRGASR